MADKTRGVASERAFEAIRFVIAGGINTLATYLLYLLFGLAVHYQIAYLLAYVIGIILSYWLNTRFVFKKQGSWSKFAKFPLVYLVNYLASGVLLMLLVEKLGIDKTIAPLGVIAVMVPVTFFLSRLILVGKSARNASGTHSLD